MGAIRWRKERPRLGGDRSLYSGVVLGGLSEERGLSDKVGIISFFDVGNEDYLIPDFAGLKPVRLFERHGLSGGKSFPNVGHRGPANG